MSQPGPPVYGEVPRYGHSQPAANQPLTPARVGPSPLPWTAVSRPPAATSFAEAGWSRRVGAFLLDVVPALLAAAALAYGYVLILLEIGRGGDFGVASPEVARGLRLLVVGGAAMVVVLGWQVYNRWVRAGGTGQSVGKRVLGLRLVGQDTGVPIGAGYAFLRDIVHILDAVTYVGFLWPLWDDHRQTFADKIMRTVVLDARDR